MEWTPGHEGIAGNEAADVAAKAAAQGKSSRRRELPEALRIRLPKSASALQQAFNKGLHARWGEARVSSPRFARLWAADRTQRPKRLRTLLHERPRWQTSIVTQLRIGHSPLNAHLHRINRSDTPLCPGCRTHRENTQHFVLECPAYADARWTMRTGLGRRSDGLYVIMSTEMGVDHLLRFINETGRLRNTIGDNPNMSKPSEDPKRRSRE